MSEEKKPELTKAMVIGNCLMGIWSFGLMVWANIWTIRTWLYQRQHGQSIGIPRLLKALNYSGYSMAQASKILKAYHVNHLQFWQFWTVEYGDPALEYTILVMPSQYDYADAILHQSGVTVISEPGTKRGYTMRPPRDYGGRRPARRPQNKTAKLGKTYR